MDSNYYINKIKFQLTGDILETEIPDESYIKILELAIQELSRYYNVSNLIQCDASSCIDINKLEEENHIKVETIVNVYRNAAVGTSSDSTTSSITDPMYIAQWNMANSYYNNNWAYKVMIYNTTNQVFNTISTDLDFKYDNAAKNLYINFSSGVPTQVVIEYIPKLEVAEDVVGNYWVDILSRLALAYAKITLGRIRTRYTQSNALWTQDGETMLNEGQTELTALRERLQTNADFVYPLD